MKRHILFFLALLGMLSAVSQVPTTTPITGSLIKIYNKNGSPAELQVMNATKGVTGGFIKNTGNGVTQFSLVQQSDVQGLTTDLSGKVPYTGATGNVTLGSFNLTAASIIKSGGTSAQFLKADGSVDANSYVTTSVASATFIPLTYMAANNGVATLDAGGKVPFSQLPSSLFIYKGTWDASTNTPTLADGVGTSGWTYRVSTSGSQDLGSGSISYVAGDYVIYNGTTWEKSDGTDAVTSVNGQQGVVVLDYSHVGAYQSGSTVANSTLFNGFDISASGGGTPDELVGWYYSGVTLRKTNAAGVQAMIGLTTSNWVDIGSTQTITGAKTFATVLTGTTGIFTGFGINANPVSTGTSPTNVRLLNTGGDFYLGIEGSTAGGFFSGSSAYAGVLYSGTPVETIIGGIKITTTSNAGFGIGAAPQFPLYVRVNTDQNFWVRDATSGVTQIGVLNNSQTSYQPMEIGTANWDIEADGDAIFSNGTFLNSGSGKTVTIGRNSGAYTYHLGIDGSSNFHLYDNDGTTSLLSVAPTTGNATFTGLVKSSLFYVSDGNATISRNSNNLELRTYGGYDINIIASSGVVNMTSQNVTASSFIKSGGTSSQYLMADGSVNTTAYLPLTGGTLTGGLTINTTTAGFLPPRMTHAQVSAISSPATGLTAFATNYSYTYGYGGALLVKASDRWRRVFFDNDNLEVTTGGSNIFAKIGRYVDHGLMAVYDTTTTQYISIESGVLSYSKSSSMSGLTLSFNNITTASTFYTQSFVPKDGNITPTLNASLTTDVGSIVTGSSTGFNITVTGAAVGDVVSLGLPSDAVVGQVYYYAYVAAANTVNVRIINEHGSTIDPPNGTYKVVVHKF